MSVVIDHVFICCSAGAPEADALAALGLTEGRPNTHPGQGTACRRFFFQNAYIELFWVSDPREAQSETVRPTRLWERWSRRGHEASPFAVIFRPEDETEGRPPFATRDYRPPYLPAPLAIEIARDTPLSEPELFFLGFQRGPARPGEEPRTHALPVTRISGVEIWTPRGARSAAAAAIEAAGFVRFGVADQHRMNLTFDDGRKGGEADLRPVLPLTLRW
jgi:hypothetical protein